MPALQKPMIKRAHRAFNTNFRQIARPEPDAKRTIGFGAAPELAKIKAAATLKEGLGSICDLIQASMACPIINMPITDQTRATMLGPVSDQTVSQFFGAEIRPFDWTNSTTGFDYVETTFAQAGEPQAHTLVCAVGWQIDVDQQSWTADGNAITNPDTATAEPPSPDYFSFNDVNNGALNVPPTFIFNGATPNAMITPAYLEWGWWAQQAAWFMARGYDLQWRMGHHTMILDEPLRHTAYLVQNGQDGSAGLSTVDIARFVRRVNDRYAQLGASQFFAKVNRIRIGSIGNNGGGAVGTPTGPNLGIFRGSRDHQRVGVTFGGGDLRSLLRGNSEFRHLTVPIIWRAGVPYGCFARVNDLTQRDLMAEYLSITQGQGAGSAIPPTEVDADNLASTNFFDGASQPPASTTIGTASALERTFDGSNVSQQYPYDNAIFKGGECKITLAFRGFEVTDDWYTLCQNNPDLRDAIMAECGCMWAKTTS
jgi:hypothetical protein